MGPVGDWLGLSSLLTANARWVLGGSLLLGASSGVLGCFALLRRRSLMGDALAHAALPGVCAAYLIVGAKSLPVLMVGALVSGLLGVLCISAITRHTRVKEDSAIGIVLSVFFGFGIVLLTRIQHSPRGNQSGLDKFLFGQAASLVAADLAVMGAVAAVLCLVTWLLFKELKVIIFDQEFARGLGLPVWGLDLLLMMLIVMAVVIGLQAVGVVLMAAMLITPPAAARFWTERLDRMVVLAGGIGALSGVAGTLVSASQPRVPTGPVMVLAASAIFLVSLVAAPRRGLLARALRLSALRRRTAEHHLLTDAYEILEPSGSWERPVPVAELALRRAVSQGQVRAVARRLQRSGHLEVEDGSVRLTEAGLRSAARVIRNHRLWELFLANEVGLAPDHLHRDADEIEHVLPPETLAKLEELMRSQTPTVLPAPHEPLTAPGGGSP